MMEWSATLTRRDLVNRIVTSFQEYGQVGWLEEQGLGRFSDLNGFRWNRPAVEKLSAAQLEYIGQRLEAWEGTGQ